MILFSRKPVLYYKEVFLLKLSKIRFAYFTPIMLTRKIVYNIAHTMSKGVPNEQYNLTSVSERERQHEYARDELLLAALPTFGGRVPVMEPPLFRNLRGNQTPAVVVVTYGCRGYDDTFLEAQAILKEQGFVVVAGAAFPAAHAIAPSVGKGRPDAGDLAVAREFGEQVRNKIEAMEQPEEYVGFPGNEPYKTPSLAQGITPITNDKCILCMQCHRWCPVDAIPYNDPNHTDPEKCILCHGCVVRCPVSARNVEDADFAQRVKGLETTLAGKSPKSEVFL